MSCSLKFPDGSYNLISDTFNENSPPTDDPAYISSLGSAVYEAMVKGDKHAVWLMQVVLLPYPTFPDLGPSCLFLYVWLICLHELARNQPKTDIRFTYARRPKKKSLEDG